MRGQEKGREEGQGGECCRYWVKDENGDKSFLNCLDDRRRDFNGLCEVVWNVVS